QLKNEDFGLTGLLVGQVILVVSMGYEFDGKAVYSALWVASITLFMELLGFSTQKWVTAGGLRT
ncbi:hypothetical protein Tco_1527010, partial [Tanacetum coccineum]